MRRGHAYLICALIMLLILASRTTDTWLAGEASAEEVLSHLLPTSPDSAAHYVNRASAYLAEGTARGRALAIKHMKQALRMDPTNQDYRMLLAEIYFESTFWEYGVDQLRQILEHYPEHDVARVRLGKAYLDRAVEQWQRKWFIRARDELLGVSTSDPAYREACTSLAQCYFDVGRPDSTAAVLKSIPEDSLGVDDFLLLGMALCEKDEMDAAFDMFTKALDSMDEETRSRYISPELVATPEELMRIADARPQHIDAATATIWKSRDPNPATAVNERLVEHLARVAFADLHFSVQRLDKVGSQTTRGEVYIRYGRPISWHFDPFGTGVFAGETVMPDPFLPDLHTRIGGGFADDYEEPDPGSHYRSRPRKADKSRWRWQYRDFSLTFEDTFLNGDYSFPYEMDWSAYVYEYLQKNIPEIYESDIKKRMRVVLDVINLMDDMGRSGLKIVYACDTRGIRFEPRYEWPQGSFDVEIAILDSVYSDVARRHFAVELRADSAALHRTRYPLIGTCLVHVPPGTSLAAVSLKSKVTGAVGFTKNAFEARRFGRSLEISDIELRFAPAGPPNPSHTYTGRGKAYLAFSVYNLMMDEHGTGNLEVAYRIVGKQDFEPVFGRFLRALTGDSAREPSGRLGALWSKYDLRTQGLRAHEVLGIDLSALASGDYEIEIGLTDSMSGETATAKTNLTIVSGIDR